MKLEPIYIAVIAPTKTGKTSLLSTVVDYIKSQTNFADGYDIVVDPDADIEICEFKNQLDGKLTQKNIRFESGLIDGTIVCSEYSFSIVFNSSDATEQYEQPFNVLDIPGAFVNNPAKAKKDYPEEYKKFEEHFRKSCILWIPIDSVVLMEPVGSQKEVAAKIRCVSHVNDYVKKWAQQARNLGKPSRVNFVLVKCETYFSQDTLKRYGFCRKEFHNEYDCVIKTIKDNNPDAISSFVAVETIGSIKLTSTNWTSDSIETKYRVCKNERVIRGAEYLLNDAISIAIQSVNDNIKNQQRKIDDNIDLANQDIENINENINILDDNEKLLNNNREQLMEELASIDRRIKNCNDTIENGGFWAWLWGDKREARNNKENAEKELKIVTKQKEAILNLLSQNDQNKSVATCAKIEAQTKIEKYRQNIKSLEKLKLQFETLKPKNTASEYFLPL